MNRTLGTVTASPQPSNLTNSRAAREPDLPPVSADRSYEINQITWEQFATPAAAQFAQSYLARRRGLDVVALG